MHHDAAPLPPPVRADTVSLGSEGAVDLTTLPDEFARTPRYGQGPQWKMLGPCKVSTTGGKGQGTATAASPKAVVIIYRRSLGRRLRIYPTSPPVPHFSVRIRDDERMMRMRWIQRYLLCCRNVERSTGEATVDRGSTYQTHPFTCDGPLADSVLVISFSSIRPE